MAKSAHGASYNFGLVEIQLLETNDFLRNMLAEMLREFNFRRVSEFHDTQDAYDYFRVNAVDIVLSSWAPGSEELEFLRLIRTSNIGPKNMVPIIVVSAYTELRQVKFARDLGMTEFLALPIATNTLYARLCTIVENPRQFIETASFYGPDRRRRQIGFEGEERRKSDAEGFNSNQPDE